MKSLIMNQNNHINIFIEEDNSISNLDTGEIIKNENIKIGLYGGLCMILISIMHILFTILFSPSKCPNQKYVFNLFLLSLVFSIGNIICCIIYAIGTIIYFYVKFEDIDTDIDVELEDNNEMRDKYEVIKSFIYFLCVMFTLSLSVMVIIEISAIAFTCFSPTLYFYIPWTIYYICIEGSYIVHIAKRGY